MSKQTATATADEAATEFAAEAPPETGTAAETAALPGWNAPRSLPQDPPDPRATLLDEDGGAPDSPSEGPSSPGSTEQKHARDVLQAHRGRVELAGQLIGGALLAAAGVLNARFAQDEDDPTWLMSDGELDGIATPLARVAARRVPLPDGTSQASDIADLVTAGITGLAYAIRNLQQGAARRRAAAAVPTFPGDDVDQDPGPAETNTVSPDPVESLRANGIGGAWG